jgi:FtsZ-binding cell division protein ZapB
VELIQHLETKIDQLIRQHQQLQDECRSLRKDASRMQDERERFKNELDTILAKLDKLERANQ